MTPSDLQALPSRDRMIEAAIDLMRGYGLSGVGINDVVRQSGAPRGSLYHFFPDGKLQIAAEALSVQGARMASFIDEALSSKRAPPRKVAALFEAFARRVEACDFQRSCAMGAVTLDLSPEAESLRLVLADIFDSWRGVIARHFQVRGAATAQSFAGLMLSCIEGAHIRARAERSGAPFREAGRWLSRLVEQAP